MLKNNLQHIKKLLFLIIGIILLNIVSSYIYKRFDLTQDNRYTLSEAAIKTIETADAPILVDVFLEGNFPPEFKRLQMETKQLLEEFSASNSNIRYEFINPLENEEDADAIRDQFAQFGLIPAQVEVKQNGKVSTEQIYPWALAYYNSKTVKIPLLKNQLGITSEERVTNSIQNLEYAFADGFNKLLNPKKRKVAVIKGNGEMEDKFVADFFKSLQDYYYIAPFTLDSISVTPKRTLEQLKTFDLIVVADPKEAFNDSEKYALDQYVMKGGASLWLLNSIDIKQDSLSGKTYAFPRNINMTDFFFKYGLRINANVIKDVYSAPIMLASGNERDAQYSRYPWLYSPLSASNNNHPIVTNIEAVKFDYTSSIDTLPNSISKTILLSSSPITKSVGMPLEIDINQEVTENLKIVNEGPSPTDFNSGELPLAILLEGEFSSVFSNRLKPFKLKNDLSFSVETKMVVISDESIIRNQFQGNRPLELGFDKWTNSFYGNKDFLLNTVNYLLDDSGLINIRTKEISIPFLDLQKTTKKRTQWQIVNILLPLLLLAIFGLIFNYIRKRKYSKFC
ncbi:gliding motility-associated ABC transporter substrate-binding protein GldG [Candidatus Marifrigoribacter sp. Uisw_064]|uniref:gliding motility-associated ABC transporter substrate-binding protein GldG n=1 Tax=Candidatus Marifrigoribacter sp. Uisw_064 TaxID=3230970 RepID=UPI003D4748A2